MAVAPRRIETPDGEILLQTERDFVAYNKWHYAPARRVGDYVHISGIIVARSADQQATLESFKTAVRETFQELKRQLAAYNCTLSQIVIINTFHDWFAPECGGQPPKAGRSIPVRQG